LSLKERERIVANLQQTIEKLQAQNRAWQQRASRGHPLGGAASPSTFRQHPDFGSNPGALQMLSYVPESIAARHSLVVVLHGCTQTAADYAVGAGWKTLADRHGFSLLLPAQKPTNNQNGCFNWFQPGDTRRGQGEAFSIHQMIETMIAEQHIDRDRIFITGLSAGGAMTSAMLAAYPEVFAAGAIIAGLPFGVAENVQQAFASMFHGSGKTQEELAELASRAAPKPLAPWPRISVWHGDADKTVVPANGREVVAQWTALHRLPRTASTIASVKSVRREAWADDTGQELVEAFSIPGLGHGTPIAAGVKPDECGQAAPFILEAGISSSFHIARFFGLTGIEVGRNSEVADRLPTSIVDPNKPATRFRDTARGDKREAAPRPSIQAVIDAALKAAGLLKGR